MNENLVYNVWLGSMYHLTPDMARYLLEIYGDGKTVYNTETAELLECVREGGFRATFELKKDLLSRSLQSAERNLKECRYFGASPLFSFQNDYPKHLAKIHEAPYLLWCKGNIGLLEKPGIAVVGTRRCSPYGRWAATEIGKRLAGCGAVVVSGMAAGIDGAAHKGALSAEGDTIAVLGTGLDVCFPTSNEAIYKMIQQFGLLISEYPFGEGGKAMNFPKRNRIISGLSSKLIVVEGGLHSGSMITAGLALEQGRDVLAVPGNINQPNSIGVNKLIADGACPIMDLEDIPLLVGLEKSREEKLLERLSFEEGKLFTLIKEAPGCGKDYLQLSTGYEPSLIAGIVSSMEIKGAIESRGYGLYVK